MRNQSGEADWGCISIAAFFIALISCITYVNVRDTDRQHEREMKKLEIELKAKDKEVGK